MAGGSGHIIAFPVIIENRFPVLSLLPITYNRIPFMPSTALSAEARSKVKTGSKAGAREIHPATLTPVAETWLRRIRLHHLEVLLAIARHGSLTAAAAALDITQPAVSQWLADIESAVGEKLFIRGQRLKPTPFAQPVLAHAERVLNDARRLGEEVNAIRAGGVGRVRIGSMLVANAALVPAVVLQLQKQATGIELSLVEDVAAELWTRFERNELDLLVTRLEARALASGLPHMRLFADQHRVVCGPDHPVLRRRKPGWADLANYGWIMPLSGTPLRQAIEATFAAQGLVLPQVLMSSGSTITNTRVMAEAHALSVMSSVAAAHFERQGVLRRLPFTLSHDIGDVGLVWREPMPGAALSIVLNCFEHCNQILNPGD